MTTAVEYDLYVWNVAKKRWNILGYYEVDHPYGLSIEVPRKIFESDYDFWCKHYGHRIFRIGRHGFDLLSFIPPLCILTWPELRQLRVQYQEEHECDWSWNMHEFYFDPEAEASHPGARYVLTSVETRIPGYGSFIEEITL